MAVASGAASLGMPLTVLFVILKVVGAIAWPWLWVLSPLIIAMGLVVVFVIGFIVLTVWILSDE